MTNTIREAIPEDAQSLRVILKQAIEVGFTSHYSRSDIADIMATSDNRFKDWMASPETMVFVAESDVTSIGFGVYEVPSARILALYTAPEYQGEGCATALLERIEQEARDEGEDKLQATVPLNSIKFFERRGFKRQHTTDQDGISMVVVAKPLS